MLSRRDPLRRLGTGDGVDVTGLILARLHDLLRAGGHRNLDVLISRGALDVAFDARAVRQVGYRLGRPTHDIADRGRTHELGGLLRRDGLEDFVLDVGLENGHLGALGVRAVIGHDQRWLVGTVLAHFGELVERMPVVLLEQVVQLSFEVRGDAA